MTKSAIAALALAALAGCASPGGEAEGPLTDAAFRRMAIDEARGAPIRSLRLIDLLRPPPRDPRR